MRLISKFICWFFLTFILFIAINLIIWTIKYWWTKAYSEILNNKDRDKSIAEISILKPKTRVAMFYEATQEDADKTVEENLLNGLDSESSAQVDDILNEFLSWDVELIDEETVNHNPYDPDYEDEFNSFFWWSSEEISEVIPVEEIEDLEPAGFVVDDSTED